MSDQDPIPFTRAGHGTGSGQLLSEAGSHARSQSSHSHATSTTTPTVVRFTRDELSAILNLYGRNVAAGQWRDYAIDMLRDKAVFSVFRKTTEYPLYRIEKVPKLARKQGAYSVVAAGGLILKRGSDLSRVIAVLDKRIALASG